MKFKNFIKSPKLYRFLPITLYGFFVVASFLYSGNCQVGLIYCSRILFMLGIPLYMAMVLFISSSGPVLYILATAISSAIYIFMLYRAGEFIEKYVIEITNKKNLKLKN